MITPFLDYPAFSFQLAYADSRIGIPRLITALRNIGEAEWKVLFEQISVVDEVLRQDPAELTPKWITQAAICIAV